VRPIQVAFAATLVCAAAVAQQPRIDSVSPSQGPIAGVTPVAISGANFTGATVKVDRVAVSPSSQTDSEIRLQMQPHDNGYVVISLENTNGAAYAEFLYVPPRLSDIPPGYITTVAGVGAYARLFGPARSATLNPWGLAFDRSGNLLITQAEPGFIFRLPADGSIEKYAGTGNRLSPVGDGGPATDASISFPRSIAVDPQGNAYVPDAQGRIRRIDGTTGKITTVAGTGVKGYSGDGGLATVAQIGQPTYVAADADSVYFIDFDAMRVRRIRDGVITTYAGNGSAGYSGDGGPATAASFDVGVDDQGGLALDSAGNLYLADSRNHRIRKVDRATAMIGTVVDASNRNSAWYAEGFSHIAFDHNDHLYFGGNGFVREFDAHGVYLRTLQGKPGSSVIDGLLDDVFMGDVTGIVIDPTGRILISDAELQRVRRIDPVTRKVETLAGIGPGVLGENGPALATITAPQDLVFSPDGELVVADACCGQGQRIRKLDSRGNLVTIAGGGLNGNTFIPRTGTAAQLQSSCAVVFDPAGNVTFVNWALGLIASLDAHGILQTTAGAPARCDYTGDGGPAMQATFCQPWDAAYDRDGNLFIADTNNNRIRRVDAQTGVVTTVVGKGGPPSGFERYNNGSYCGDGGPAVDACINTPYGVELDPDGNLYISEAQRVRRVDPSGTITTFANGSMNKMVFDRGFLYAMQFPTVHRFDPAGTKTILAGNGTPGFSGDGGPALAAEVAIGLQAAGVAIDREGNIFFGDSTRIRAIRYGAVLAPAGATISATRSGNTLRATVLDSSGRTAPSVRVEFSAPSSGASCTLSSPFAITDATGVATVTCTPNCVPGTYAVVAQPLTALSTASVSFTNENVPCRRRSVRH